MSENTIGMMRIDQLAGRLSTLLNAWRVAQRTDARLIVCWPKRTAHAPGQDFSITQILDMKAFKPTRDFAFVEDKKRFDCIFNPDSDARELFRRYKRKILPQHMFESGRSLLFEEHNNPVFADETLDEASRGIRSLFKLLPIKDDIRQALDEVKQRVALSKLVAVHLRRGDIVRRVSAEDYDVTTYEGQKWMKFFVSRFVPFGSYFRQLEQMGHPDIIVYSDVERDAEAFASSYPGSAVLSSKFLPKERTTSPLADALLEFLMIGSATTTIGSRYSLFSFYSTWLADKAFIDMIETLRASEIIPEVNALFPLSDRRHVQDTAAEFLKHYREQYFSNLHTNDAQAIEDAIYLRRGKT